MKSLSGEKSNFAIEYKILKKSSHVLGNACLWIKGEKLGFAEEEVNLESFFNSLNMLNSRLNSLNDITITNKTIDRIFDEIYNDNRDNGKYLLSLGANFDDFEIFVLTRGNEIHFFWQFIDDPFHEYKNFSPARYHKVIKVDKFKEILDQLKPLIVNPE